MPESPKNHAGDGATSRRFSDQPELNVVITVDGGVVKCNVLPEAPRPRRREAARRE